MAASPSWTCPVWFDLPRGLADSVAAGPDVTVTVTIEFSPSYPTSFRSRRPPRSPVNTTNSSPKRQRNTRSFPRHREHSAHDTNQAIAMADEAVKEFGGPLIIHPADTT